MQRSHSYIRLCACLALLALYGMAQEGPFIYYWNCGPDIANYETFACRSRIVTTHGGVSTWADVDCSNDYHYSQYVSAGADNCGSSISVETSAARLGSGTFRYGSWVSGAAPCGSSYSELFCTGVVGTEMPGCTGPC